ncbi:MAG: ABC transporter substrate-binding protein [Actinomycetota bacterium]
MVFHPRQGGSRRRGGGWPWGRPVSRREFLRMTGGSALAAAWLAACGGGQGPFTGGGGNGGLRIGTPENPVTQPLFDDNPAIDSGLDPEPGPLRLYNWADYIWPRVLKDFQEEFGVEFELSTFFNLEEGIQKLQSGEVAFDIFFPTAENIPKLIAGKLLQPLNHDYLPNLEPNIWPRLSSPYYDQESRYTVPYTVYETGIGWREDMAKSTPEDFDNPWDVFWDPANADITGLYDDYRETIGVGIYHLGETDINSGDADLVTRAKDGLVEAVNALNMAFTIDGAYIQLPEAKLGLHHAWSGDVAAAPYYAPKGVDPTVLRWMWPPKNSSFNGGYVSNDAMGIPRNAEHPVLAHMFLNYMLDRDVALKNFSWVLYQPPLQGLEPESLVSDGYIPEYVSSTVVLEEDFQMGQAPVQLTPEAEALWLRAWSEVKAGG